VEQTIDELGLRDAADTVVGGPLRKGISGGEKRRLSIGCVLVTLPSVLILDVSQFPQPRYLADSSRNQPPV
jgi:ABC-type multidrug transport system ATPase subunit